MSSVDIVIPDIGDIDSVEVIEILVNAGDSVAIEDSLLTVESDKASMEIPAVAAGIVMSIDIDVGAQVKAGDRIGSIEVAAAVDAAATEVTATTAAAPDDDEPKKAADSSAAIQIVVPDIGDVDDVEVIEILVAAGDTVTVDQSLLTVESDKASMEIPSTHQGVIETLNVRVGDKVSQGVALLTLLESSTAADSSESVNHKQADSVASTNTDRKAPKTGTAAQIEATGNALDEKPSPSTRQASPTAHIEKTDKTKVHASPGVRRYAREHGADLGLVKGSGRKNRVVKSDVKAFIKQSMESAGSNYGGHAAAGGAGIPSVPDIDFSKFGAIERVALGRINKVSASNLHRAWLNVPMVTHHDEADITEVESFRKALKAEAREGDPKITGLAFHMKALVQSLKEFPKLNSSLTADGQSLIYKNYYHIGIAVDTSNGLVVPVFRDVDKKSISELAVEMSELSQRAREKKLKPDEMQGASMTISSLGGIGGTAFTPIVNTPEVAILGITRARMQPVWDGNEFIPRLMCPLDLSYDHRVVDGADAARFMAFYCKTISDVRRLLI